MSLGKCVRMIVAMLALAGSAMQGQQVPVTRDNRTIQVSATAEATAEADAATVHVGFQTYGSDSDAAYAAGSKLSNAIVAALKSTGVKEGAIESEDQSLAEMDQDNMPKEQRANRHYRLQQSWTVKTSAKDAARVLDAAVKAGANQSGQIDWRMADPDALHAKAVEAAVAKARKNAEGIAAGLGVRAGALLYASNDRPFLNRIQNLVSPSSAASEVNAKSVRPLATRPQQMRDSATISAVYAIE